MVKIADRNVMDLLQQILSVNITDDYFDAKARDRSPEIFTDDVCVTVRKEFPDGHDNYFVTIELGKSDFMETEPERPKREFLFLESYGDCQIYNNDNPKFTLGYRVFRGSYPHTVAIDLETFEIYGCWFAKNQENPSEDYRHLVMSKFSQMKPSHGRIYTDRFNRKRPYFFCPCKYAMIEVLEMNDGFNRLHSDMEIYLHFGNEYFVYNTEGYTYRITCGE